MGKSSLNGKIIEVNSCFIWLSDGIHNCLDIIYSNQTIHDSFITILVEFLLSILWELLYVCLDILMLWYPWD
jgi:hypothetical protein